MRVSYDRVYNARIQGLVSIQLPLEIFSNWPPLDDYITFFLLSRSEGKASSLFVIAAAISAIGDHLDAELSLSNCCLDQRDAVLSALA